MRYRVDTIYGYVSYDERSRDEAFALYKESGLRIRICRNIFDEGTVLEGLPLHVDLKNAGQA